MIVTVRRLAPPPAEEKLGMAGLSLVFAGGPGFGGPMQKRFRHMGIEPLDDRPHKQGGNNRANAHIGMEKESDDDADGVAGHTAKTEWKELIFIGGNQGYGVIAGHAQVGGKIQGS